MQIITPDRKNYEFINKRINWQLENAQKRFFYIFINFKKTKLFVFVDGFFANNKNLNLQIGFIIILGNKNCDEQKIGFRVIGNILY